MRVLRAVHRRRDENDLRGLTRTNQLTQRSKDFIRQVKALVKNQRVYRQATASLRRARAKKHRRIVRKGDVFLAVGLPHVRNAETLILPPIQQVRIGLDDLPQTLLRVNGGVHEMRCVKNRLLFEEVDAGKLTRDEHLALAVLAGHNGDHLARGPAALLIGAAHIPQQVLLPRVQGQAAPPGEFHRLVTARRIPIGNEREPRLLDSKQSHRATPPLPRPP